jgi:thioredoxin 2
MSSTLSVCPDCKSLNKIDITKAKIKTPTCGKCGKKLELYGLTSLVNEADLERILNKSEKPVVVDFWAPWCGPCRSYGPEFEKASSQNEQAVFLKINIDENQALSSKLGIRGVPCTILFQNGKEVKRQSGALSSSQLSKFITY